MMATEEQEPPEQEDEEQPQQEVAIVEQKERPPPEIATTDHVPRHSDDDPIEGRPAPTSEDGPIRTAASEEHGRYTSYTDAPLDIGAQIEYTPDLSSCSSWYAQRTSLSSYFHTIPQPTGCMLAQVRGDRPQQVCRRKLRRQGPSSLRRSTLVRNYRGWSSAVSGVGRPRPATPTAATSASRLVHVATAR